MERFLFFFLLWGFASQAQILKEKNRISPSYQSVIQCYPGLVSTDLQGDLQLSRLKEKIDQAFPNLQSLEVSKMWVVKNPKGIRTRISLTSSLKKEGSSKSLRVEKLDYNDVGEEIQIPAEHRLHASQKTVNTYLYGNDILEEVTERIDTKLNGLQQITRQSRKGLIWLELQDSRSGKKLQCELEKKLGLICLCRKK